MKSISYLIIGLVLGLIGVGVINITNDARYALISAVGIVLMTIACVKQYNE
jgi:sulfite exporter TauE/SafE